MAGREGVGERWQEEKEWEKDGRKRRRGRKVKEREGVIEKIKGVEREGRK